MCVCATDKSQSSDSRNFVLANQVDDSTEVMKSGNSFHFYLFSFHFASLFWTIRLYTVALKIDLQSDRQKLIHRYWIVSNFRFMGLSILFIRMHFDAIVNISITESCSDCIIPILYIVIMLFFNTSLDFHQMQRMYFSWVTVYDNMIASNEIWSHFNQNERKHHSAFHSLDAIKYLISKQIIQKIISDSVRIINIHGKCEKKRTVTVHSIRVIDREKGMIQYLYTKHNF